MPANILVVDDDTDHARMVQATLESTGYTTSVASGGRAALEQTRNRRPDLMILDLAMPEMDGWQVLQQLRAEAATATLPVILLTAKSEESDIAMSWHLGADLFLTKPFSAPTLLSFVERLLNEMNKSRSHTRKTRH
jgi:DNA-binding response OmpR family regulator